MYMHTCWEREYMFLLFALAPAILVASDLLFDENMKTLVQTPCQ